MECPDCYFVTQDKANFCSQCGTRLDNSTPDLRPLNDKIDKIQRYLPKGLTEKILSQKDRIEGERKQVTVLFCDLVDFTSLSEKLGPEDTYAIMDRVMEMLIQKVHDYGGTVNQILGDGLYALFGVPIAIEKGASRAIRSAMEMHRAITELGQRIPGEKQVSPLQLRVGINSGPVVIGTIGNSLRVNFSVVGDTVNLASRMEGLAKPGTTAVTAQTWKQTRDFFIFEDLGLQTVKGKEEPVPVYKVVSKKSRSPHKQNQERAIQSRMVGRESELEKLEQAVTNAKNGRGAIVNVIGEAGIGKSRLIAELKHSDVIKKTTILEGRALSMGRNLSFYPIIEILKGFARIGEDDSAVQQIYKLDQAIRRVYPEQADEIIPFVASLMGMQLSGKHSERVNGIEGEALEKLIYKSVKDLVIKSAERTALIFILEDLHWADASSINLIIFLCQMAEDSKLLIINVFRPHYPETGERLKKRVAEAHPALCTEIELHRLNQEQSDLLLNNLLGIEGLPADFREQLKRRSEGNPFFIEEMARSMIDEGAIELKNGTFTITGKISSVIFPNTIQELLMSRIDRLDEKTRSLLRTASVIGRHFFHKILAEIVTSPEGIDEKMEYLQEIQLIREGKRMEEVEYLFKHALAQEATYDSILTDKRKELHLQVAESFERVFSDRLNVFYGMLAYHYVKAERPDKAEEFMIKAGEEAIKSSAPSEALHYYQEAMNLYTQKFGDAVDPVKMADLEEKIAFALHQKGYNEEADAFFDRALFHLGHRFPKTDFMSKTHTVKGLWGTMLMFHFQQGAKNKVVPDEMTNRLLKIWSAHVLAISITNPGKSLSRSVGLFKEIYKFDISNNQVLFDCIVRLASFLIIGDVSLTLGWKLIRFARENTPGQQDDRFESLALFDIIHSVLFGDFSYKIDNMIIDRLLKAGDVSTVTHIESFSNMQGYESGDFDACDRNLERLKKCYDDFRNENSLACYYQGKAFCLYKKRELARSLKNLESAMAQNKKSGSLLMELRNLFLTARLYILDNNQFEASKKLQSGMKLVSRNKSKQVSIAKHLIAQQATTELAYNLFMLEKTNKKNSRRGISELKREFLRIVKTKLKTMKATSISSTENFQLIGSNYWVLGRQRKALKWWSRSVRRGLELGARPDLSRTYLEIGKRLLEPGSRH